VSRFILASGSPRRTQLLIEAGFQPEVVLPSTTELHTDYLTPRELTLFNAHRKALAVALLHPDAVVLGADTLVALGTKVFGKPTDFADAREMLLELSGKSHDVITSVSVIHAALGLVVTESVHSTVTFKVLDDAAIERYFQLVHPLDKAGAYAAQIDSTSIIERVDGSFTNVVGLPMEMVTAILREFGIEPS
jgi:nucleoside triphosphate pyrophosphatase